MEALAEVLALDGNRLRVKVRDAGTGCGRCDEPGGCRSLRLTHAFGAPCSEFQLKAPSGLNVQVGDQVRIRIAEGAALKAALAAYGLGAAALLGGGALAHWLWPAAGDLATLSGAVGGLLLAVASNRVLMRSRRWRGQFQLELLTPEQLAATVSLASAGCSLGRH